MAAIAAAVWDSAGAGAADRMSLLGQPELSTGNAAAAAAVAE